jgi:hypothetical protein
VDSAIESSPKELRACYQRWPVTRDGPEV